MTDREHFEQLAAELGATFDYSRPRWGSRVNLITRHVEAEPFKADEDDEAYPPALHELGHLATEQVWPEWDAATLLGNEARAWRWALERIRRPLVGLLHVEAAGGIASYLRNGSFPDSPGADDVRAVLELLGEVELPWPKTNAALQQGRADYLGVTA